MPADSGIKFPSALSGGMVKRAAFARALALDPRILFLDEPTSDLDPIAASGIDALIRQLNDSLGVTVVIVTHDLTTLFTICGRIAVLVDRNVTVDTADKLMKSDHPWIHEFFHGPRAEGAMKARKSKPWKLTGTISSRGCSSSSSPSPRPSSPCGWEAPAAVTT